MININSYKSQYLVIIRRPVKNGSQTGRSLRPTFSKNTILGYKDPEILWSKFSQSWILVLVNISTVATGWLARWTAGLLQT